MNTVCREPSSGEEGPCIAGRRPQWSVLWGCHWVLWGKEPRPPFHGGQHVALWPQQLPPFWRGDSDREQGGLAVHATHAAHVLFVFVTVIISIQKLLG